MLALGTAATYVTQHPTMQRLLYTSVPIYTASLRCHAAATLANPGATRWRAREGSASPRPQPPSTTDSGAGAAAGRTSPSDHSTSPPPSTELPSVHPSGRRGAPLWATCSLCWRAARNVSRPGSQATLPAVLTSRATAASGPRPSPPTQLPLRPELPSAMAGAAADRATWTCGGARSRTQSSGVRRGSV